MTAVAEGAAIFAESIDWTSTSRGRKGAKGAINAGGPAELSFTYIARTPDSKAKIVAKLRKPATAGSEFQIDSLDTGWSSGRMSLSDGASVELNLAKPGENVFKVFVFDARGGRIPLDQDKIVISRTAASIDAIPASHSVGVEAREKIGGPFGLAYLVREGEQLPKKGKKVFRTEGSLKAGSAGAINFKLWEGDIIDPIKDNRFIGMFQIKGSDFDDGVIAAGAELMCTYEVRDSGNIILEVSVPSIGGLFHARNYYSRQEGQIDYTKASRLIMDQSEEVHSRLAEMAAKVDDTRLDRAREKLEAVESLKDNQGDPETAKQAMDDVQEAKRLLAATRKEHLKETRQLELDKVTDFFNQAIRQYARSSEQSAFDNLLRTAQRAIDNNSGEFESHVDELRGKSLAILWRQDWFVIDRFKQLAQDSYLFPDAREHAELVEAGSLALKENDIEKLRKTVARLEMSRIGSVGEDDIFAGANIVRN
jgi:molecular chaperone DnaK